jgi:hypothetical protein
MLLPRLLSMLLASIASCLPAAQVGTPPQPTPMEWVHDLIRKGGRSSDFEQGKRVVCALIFDTDTDVDGSLCLARCLVETGDPEQGAAFYHIAQRILARTAPPPPEAAAWQRQIAQALAKLDQRYAADAKAYREAATKPKHWESPAQADERWMTQAEFDPAPVHGLYAWRIIGGRSDKPADWLHNQQGAVHRSGAKWMDAIAGRKGVFFYPTSGKRLHWRGPADKAVLHLGVFGQGNTCQVTVFVDGKNMFEKRIAGAYVGAADQAPWEDLVIPLGVGPEQRAIEVEFTKPQDQRWADGVFIDYLEMCDD